jgi:hypothetical protein
MDAYEVADEVVARYFPLDGPYDDERTAAAAQTIAELVRYLNYATRYEEAARWPASVDRVLGALGDAAYGQVQALDQLGSRLAMAAARPCAYLATELPDAATAKDAAHRVVDELLPAARTAACRFRAAIGRVRRYTHQIGGER